MKANKDNADSAAQELENVATRLAILATFIRNHEGVEVCRMDSHEEYYVEAMECSHAWYFANEYGGYILCADESNEGDAIEAFGDYFLAMGYKGLIHEPGDLKSSYTMDEIDETFYPYNGGEMWIDIPVVLERIY